MCTGGKSNQGPLGPKSDALSTAPLRPSIGLDLFEIQGKQYLIAVDYYSNFIEVDRLTTRFTSARVITLLKKQFAIFGIPRTIVSDGGPKFSSQEFEIFVKQWGITHIMSSPGPQSANWKAESAVKIIKNMMIKTMKDGQDQYQALLELRNTPRQDSNLSPAEMMFGRNTWSVLPEINQQKPVDCEKRISRKHAVRKSYDKRSHRCHHVDLVIKQVQINSTQLIGWITLKLKTSFVLLFY